MGEQFERRSVTYRASEKSKSDIYRELLPLLNSKRVELLDIPRLHAQLGGLERRTARGLADKRPLGFRQARGPAEAIGKRGGQVAVASRVGSPPVDVGKQWHDRRIPCGKDRSRKWLWPGR